LLTRNDEDGTDRLVFGAESRGGGVETRFVPGEEARAVDGRGDRDEAALSDRGQHDEVEFAVAAFSRPLRAISLQKKNNQDNLLEECHISPGRC
jgi:hypothetical protein